MNGLGKRAGSVLANWIVVLLALALVAAMLYPAFFARARSYSGPGCLGAMKGLTRWLGVYEQDWDGRLPPADAWADSLRPYTTDPRLFMCPNARGPYGYAMNAWVGGMAPAKLRAPAEVVLLFESDAGVPNANGGPGMLAGEDRHGGMLNWGFADGHVERRSRVPSATMRWHP